AAAAPARRLRRRRRTARRTKTRIPPSPGAAASTLAGCSLAGTTRLSENNTPQGGFAVRSGGKFGNMGRSAPGRAKPRRPAPPTASPISPRCGPFVFSGTGDFLSPDGFAHSRKNSAALSAGIMLRGRADMLFLLLRLRRSGQQGENALRLGRRAARG